MTSRLALGSVIWLVLAATRAALRAEPPTPKGIDAETIAAYLVLAQTQVTDAGLKELAGMKALTEIGLDAQVSDAGLKSLREMGLLHAISPARAAKNQRPPFG